jgi:hypothetical protein
MKLASQAAAESCCVERYLDGTLEAPLRGSDTSAPLALFLTARCGHRVPSLRRPDPSHFHGDVGLASAYAMAIRIVADYRVARLLDPAQAEKTFRDQAVGLLAHCVVRLKAHAEAAASDLADERAFDIADEYRALAGLAALAAHEMNVGEGTSYIEGLLADLIRIPPGGHAYVDALLGLRGEPYIPHWRPGQGSLGRLASALSIGGDLVGRANFARQPALPEEEPDWAIEAREKAERDRVERARIDDGPSLMVLASVSHLPGAAEDGKGKPGSATGSTARAEWAPYAGRRWRLASVPDLAAAREILVAEFPYAADVIDAVLHDLAGRPHVHLRPVLLVGAPGSGKTRLARRLAEVLGLGWQIYSCSGVADSSLIGTSRQWSTGRASIPLQLLKRLQAASGAVVLDEIDKTGTSQHNGALLDGILPFLTPDAARIFDPYLECQVDLSGVSWIATANDIRGLRRSHPALVDRFRVFHVPAPGREHLPVLLKGVVAELRAERGLDEAWMPDLTPEEASLVTAHYRGRSVRAVRRLCEAVLAGREHLATRN